MRQLMPRSARIQLLAAAISLALSVPAGAATLYYQAALSGPAESPPNASPGVGTAQLTIDDVAHTMRVQATFSGLLGTTSACHMHAPTAVAGTGTASVATMVPAFTGFPLGVTSGAMDNTFSLTNTATYNGPYVTANGGNAAGAEAALLAALAAGKVYFNIHTNVVPGGEIRGFLAAFNPTLVHANTWGTLKALYR